jgi:serine O-acetyltransferase
MFHTIKQFKKYDPAAKSYLEILLLYPGVKAVFFHRISHFFYKLKLYFIARLISEFSRFITGIEIHPGAKIGKGVMIDHGIGVVIGETAEIGDNCLIYQGVTLGGTDLNPVKRHPTLEANVVVGAGAKILGNINIGAHTRIGANSVVVESCPPYSTLVGIPAKQIRKGIKEGEELLHQKIKEEE